MENQIVPQGDIGCAPSRETGQNCMGSALVPVAVPNKLPAVCNGLKRRIEQAAQNAGLPDPVVLPGACVTLLPVDLPLITARLRLKALPFALEDQLSQPTDQMALCIGPELGANRYLAAACSMNFLQSKIPPRGVSGAVLPDLLGVPAPDTDNTWNMWCTDHTAYVRASGGGGFTCRADVLPIVWQAVGRPTVISLTGALPHGPEARDVSDNPPAVALADLKFDLRTRQMRAHHHRWRSLARFAMATLLVATIGQLGLLAWDTRALRSIALTRLDHVAKQLSNHSPGLTPELPLTVIADRLFPASLPAQQDIFMTLLADVSAELSGLSNTISFREMRFGGQDGVLTLLVQGDGLDSLQTAELALKNAGLNITSGAATATEGGAEMFMQITGTGR